MAQVVDAEGRVTEYNYDKVAQPVEENVYLDSEKMDILLEAMGYSAEALQIPDDAFTNEESAEGTNTIESINKIWKSVQKMSNRYKSYMSVDVSGLFVESTNNIVAESQAAGDAMKAK